MLVNEAIQAVVVNKIIYNIDTFPQIIVLRVFLHLLVPMLQQQLLQWNPRYLTN